MPGRDGTGPIGLGPQSGRNYCSRTTMNKCGFGLGRGFNQRCWRNSNTNTSVSSSEKEFLTEQKTILENRLDFISKKLENL